MYPRDGMSMVTNWDLNNAHAWLRALALDEKSYGVEHPDVAIRLNNQATLLHVTNRLAEAEPLIRRALAIDEQSYGAEHLDVAIDLNRPHIDRKPFRREY
ncbi:MAG: hypothetical protein ACI814_003192 [Mariniblastus sp.]|jgi:hypothetical protein